VKNQQKIIESPVKVYFLGTGSISVPLLKELNDNPSIELVGCGTQPDRPAGRKRKLEASPIAKFATEQNIAIDKPDSVNDCTFLEKLKKIQPEIIVVMCFGQILRRDILELCSFGCLNIHVSLLPRHRGASPVNAAILHNDKETGITFMKMVRGLDTGDIYKSILVPIDTDETAITLEKKLAVISAKNICATIKEICRAGLAPTPQSSHGATYAHQLQKKDGLIDWSMPAETVERKIRALVPWPGTYTWICSKKRNKRLQITKATVIKTVNKNFKPGEITQADKQNWTVACGTNLLQIEKIIPEGSREMTAEEFLRGNPVTVASILGKKEQ